MQKKERIHCIGIGGIGMNGVAQILFDKGSQVTGSDIEDSPILEDMRKKGIKIFIGHNEDYITKDIAKIIYTSAIPENNPELVKAKKIGIPVFTFAQAVKAISDNLYTIAVCGTHGKTTITGMCAVALLAGDKDPTVIIGSKINEFGGASYRVGNGKYFLVEACEYKRNFLNFDPDIIIMSNIEADHLDYFKDIEDYKNAYKEFISKLPNDGFLITNADDKNVRDVIKDYKGSLILFSEKDKNCEWFIQDNQIYKNGEKAGELLLNVPGDFNRLNALCAVILGQILNIEREKLLAALSSYKGAWRRFEYIGDFMGIKLISDYAHHPTAITKTLSAAKQKFNDQKICVIYQPHQFNRTRHFINEFSESLKIADICIIPNIYKVRDTAEDFKKISAADLVELINKKGGHAKLISEYEDIREFLIQKRKEIDIIIIMGAGDIWLFGDYLLKNHDLKCSVCED
ncbi:UDP-N-acetylmuramate--L-alanine ligase [Candidatus Peregrinibacteria bacterium]|nr:UDP-N-acetylmuramate--L-alanine ligase [Candidatus Peregrinibacteria bacterium]